MEQREAVFGPHPLLYRYSDQLTVARKTSVRVAPAAIVAIVPDTFGAA